MLIKSINYWSFPGGLEGSLPVSEALELAKAHGFEAIELGLFETGGVPFSASEADCRAIAQHASDLGLQLLSTASGSYWGRNLASADPSDRAKAKEDLKAMIRISHWLGSKTLLTIPGAVDVFFLPERPVQRYDDVIKFAQDGLAELLPEAEAAEVRLGIENVWNRILLSPTEMASFLDGFGSKWIGSYFDVGNILPFGYPEQWIRILGHRIVGVHFKDYRRAVGTADGFVDLLEGDVNWPEVIAALSEVGYSGPVAAEMIPGYRHYPIVRIANTSRAMDAILGRA